MIRDLQGMRSEAKIYALPVWCASRPAIGARKLRGRAGEEFIISMNPLDDP